MVEANSRSQRSIAVDDNLAAVAIDIPIVIALLDDNRVSIAVIVAVANHFTLANDITVTMTFADRHADRTHTDADFFGACRQCGSNKRRSRDYSQT
jgi:hypothetical protein